MLATKQRWKSVQELYKHQAAIYYLRSPRQYIRTERQFNAHLYYNLVTLCTSQFRRCPPPFPANPPASAFSLNIPEVGTKKLVKCPRVKPKKEGKCSISGFIQKTTLLKFCMPVVYVYVYLYPDLLRVQVANTQTNQYEANSRFFL